MARKARGKRPLRMDGIIADVLKRDIERMVISGKRGGDRIVVEDLKRHGGVFARKRRFWWKRIARNGERLHGPTEGYASKSMCKKMARRSFVPCPIVEE